METGAVTVHKDLSLFSLIPKWSGSDSTISLEEFFSSIESSAKIANWKQTDQLQIAILKLSGGAKTIYQGCTELHTKETDWQTFKEAFRSRYKDVHTDQYHFIRLQTAHQKKNESPRILPTGVVNYHRKLHANWTTLKLSARIVKMQSECY